MWHHGLDAIRGTTVHASIQAGLSEAKALGMYQNRAPDPISTPASLLKHPYSLSPPLTRPTSPPPQISSCYGKAPQNWRLWIATQHQVRGGQGTLEKSTLIELADII